MDGGRRHGDALMFQIARRAGVLDDSRLVAEITGGSGGRVDAHVAHGADDHDILDPVGIKNLLQFGLEEGIRIVLDHDRLAFDRRHDRIDLDAF